MENLLKLTVLGAGRCVGGSCLKFEDGKNVVVCDIGKNVNQELNNSGANTLYPRVGNYKKVDLVIVTHPHMDHSGGIPYAVEQGLDCEIVCPSITAEICNVLFSDDYKIQTRNNGRANYSSEAIRRALNLMKDRESGKCGSFVYSLIAAGHIPGAVCVDLEHKGKKILYTGDINGLNTRLMNGHDPLSKRDILILDCTYGNKILKSRYQAEQEIEEMIVKTIKNGGSVLIGAFAVERAQEAMLFVKALRHKTKLSFKAYLDGMAIEITDILIRNNNLLRDDQLLEANKQTIRVHSKEMRYRINQQPRSIFIASSGMLTGGSVMSYLNKLTWDKKNCIILPGYQAEGTPGRKLVETGAINRFGKDTFVKCKVFNPSFSPHADFNGLKEIIKIVKPKMLIAQHGEEAAVDNVVAYAKQQGISAIAPKNGDTIYL
jgi:putative mRNA 3-end processing factor